MGVGATVCRHGCSGGGVGARQGATPAPWAPVPRRALSATTTAQATAAPAVGERRGSHRRAPSPQVRRRRFLALAGLIYLALAMWWWSHAWASGWTDHSACSCGDPALFQWFIEWPAYALAHGLNPLYSRAMLHPGGVNLLANTSELGIGIPLAPITLAFGPVATINVANTAMPALSGLAMCWLLSRFSVGRLAAFCGGLLYGFSPFMLVADAGSYLMLSSLFVLPLVVGCLDELLVRQRRSPFVSGATLSILLTIQFFLSTEVFAMTLLVGVVATIVLVAGALALRPASVAIRLPGAARALAVGLGLGGLLLAYPVWFALAGPAHLSGPIWGTTTAIGGNQLSSYVDLVHLPASFTATIHRLGGYQGPPLPAPTALGVVLLAVLGVGWALYWRDGRLWLFGVTGALLAAFSLGVSRGHWTPWRLFARVPVFENIIPSRFSLFVNLCAAIMLGIVLHHLSGSLTRLLGPRPLALMAGPTAAAAVAVVSLAPLAALEASNVPLTTPAVVVPRFVRVVAPTLPRGQVLLTYPPLGSQAAEAWQAVTKMAYSMVGGGGPGSAPARAGAERQGARVLAQLSTPLGPPPAADPASLSALRQALRAWGVTMVVVPDQPGLPAYARGRPVPTVASYVTAVLGHRPRSQAGALVWAQVPSDLDRLMGGGR